MFSFFHGVACCSEINISVNFIHPESGGRHHPVIVVGTESPASFKTAAPSADLHHILPAAMVDMLS